METLTRTVDPITFEILSHRLHQIAKETGVTLERVGGTVNTTQMHDYAAAVYRANGEILSAAAESMRICVRRKESTAKETDAEGLDYFEVPITFTEIGDD